MSENVVMKIDDIEGESKTSGYEKWIDCSSVNYSFYNPALTSGSGQSGGALQATPIHVTALAGAHFPTLMTKQANGKHWNSVEIKFLKTGLGNKLEPFRIIKLEKAFISDYQPSGSAQAGGYDTLTITYEKITDEYQEQQSDGTFQNKGKVIYSSVEKKVYS